MSGLCSLLVGHAFGEALPFTVFPQKVSLFAGEESQQLLISTVNASGLEEDITSKAAFLSEHPHLATVNAAGVVHGIEPGTATITVRWAAHTQSITVTVEPALQRQLTFLHDVIPIINRARCNAGACHAKPRVH